MRRKTIPFNMTDEQLEKMFGPSNELTMKSWKHIWPANVLENLQTFDPEPIRGLKDLITHVNFHIAMVFGAGPSLRRLKFHAHKIPAEWGLIVTDHALKAVLECGLKPSIVLTMDGDQKSMHSYGEVIIEGFDMLQTMYPETPVVCDIVACNEVVRRLKNPFFFRTAGDAKELLYRYLAREAPGLAYIGHGGNVGSVACILAKFFCYARHVILVGLDCALREGTKRNGYWYDQKMGEQHQYIDVNDIYGRPILTMANLYNYKWWFEHFFHMNDDVEWIHANEGGFLGVASPGENYDHFKYMSLKDAVDYMLEHGEED